jgi:hypothetical protein
MGGTSPDAIDPWRRAAVPGRSEALVVTVAGEVAVRDHVGQGIAWPPPFANATDYAVGCSRKRRVILSPPRGYVKVLAEKFAWKSFVAWGQLLYHFA